MAVDSSDRAASGCRKSRKIIKILSVEELDVPVVLYGVDLWPNFDFRAEIKDEVVLVFGLGILAKSSILRSRDAIVSHYGGQISRRKCLPEIESRIFWLLERYL